MRSRRTPLLVGLILISVGIVGAMLESYHHMHTAVIGVVLAAFGGRVIGETYHKANK